MNNTLYYNTSIDKFAAIYPHAQFPFKSGKIRTQLPKNIAFIRAVAAVAFSVLLAWRYSASFFCWPAAAIAAAYAGWTIYSHIYSNDPLLKAFYQIAGGKENFEKLPEIQLGKTSDEKLSDVIERLSWNELKNPIARAQTWDGRNVVIVKAVTRHKEEWGLSCAKVKSVLAFIEKYGPSDDHALIQVPDLIRSVFYAVFKPFGGNSFGRKIYTKSWGLGRNSRICFCQIYSAISERMANELHAQMNGF